MEAYDPEELHGPNFCYIVVGVSTCLFTLNNLLVLNEIAPSSAKKTKEQLWKWRNTANSLVHSFISGSWALLNFWATPEVRDNLLSIYTSSIQALISFSVGYFIYDLVDMVANHRKRGTYELVLHHLLVIVCFSLALVTRRYHGYTLIALLVEINSVFLHVRQLLIVQGWNKNSTFYRVNSVLNLGTFIVFRLVTFGWMFRWLNEHSHELPSSHFKLGVATMFVVITMSLVLFYRVISKDAEALFAVRTGKEDFRTKEE